MSASWTSILRRHVGRHIFEVRTRIKGTGETIGFVVDFSADLILFHVLDTDVFELNGYSVIHAADVKKYRAFNRSEFWLARAVRRFGLTPVHPSGISLSSLPDLLKSTAERFPLITIHMPKRNPDVCYIGDLLSLDKTTFTIDDLDSRANWTGPRRFRYDDVTRVDFGGGYEKALAATAPMRRRRKKRNRSSTSLTARMA
jgi:hypothetical protein